MLRRGNINKQEQTPEENLGPFYEKGLSCLFKPMTRFQVRKHYFNWLKNKEDNRTFEEYFGERFDQHFKYWSKQYNIKSTNFAPKKVGKTSIEYVDGYGVLCFDSIYHRQLKIMKPIKGHSKFLRWIKVKIREYCKENVVTIDYDMLKANLEAPIITTILL